VAPAAIRAAVPRSLAVDTFDGEAWLGITPFRLTWLRPRGAPGLMCFPEMNVRTYVSRGGVPGIFFFSLEAASTLAVVGARLTYGLPYRRANMRATADGEWIDYRSERPGLIFDGRYRPVGPAFNAVPGTLVHWFTERYRLYTGRWGADIHHPPWPLQVAEAELRSHAPAPQLHYARRQDIIAWPLWRRRASASVSSSSTPGSSSP
jgi:uncharacterized protein YqjF (DUF2071 family)